MTEYGDRLATALEARNVSVQRLADHLGVSYQAVKKVLDGKTNEFSASNHAKTCQFLNIGPGWLLDGSGDMTPTLKAQGLSGKALQLGALLDRVKDADTRLQMFSYCVLVLTQNQKYKPPFPAPTPAPADTTQKPPERIPGERPK